MKTLNLGILAHVDAGKTSLTERLLHAAGVIDEVGSVDEGSTLTDSLALERQRGITIKSAVVSFAVDDVTVNLIDTPGHPDFIAEVERVLSVLDGAVLVISAVEGVQAQTRVLMRTLQRLGIPTLLFVNKIDRAGAQYEPVLRRIAEKLTPAAVAMGRVRGLGTRTAEFTTHGASDESFTARLAEVLAEHDDAVLAAYVEDESALSHERLRGELAAQSKRGSVHPVFFGSAITGAGVEALTAGLKELLPAAEGDPDAPAHGIVFKVERAAGGQKTAYVRMFSGTVRVRDRLLHGDEGEGKVTGIDVFDNGSDAPRPCVEAGRIGKLRGLAGVRIGDAVGSVRKLTREEHHFAPPTLETVVLPCRPEESGALHTALTQLAEQDPLIGLRQDELRGEIHVSLYGEVQKEVVQATLADEFGLHVAFRESTTICVERLDGPGSAAEIMNKEPNPFLATVGLRIEPAPPGSGVRYGLEVELGSMPYAFMRAVEDTVRETLREGIHGWEIPDCTVTMTHSGYAPRQSHAHAIFDKSMSSTGADFRQLTPLVVMDALRDAGTTVHEPMHRFRLEIPAETFGAVLPVLSRLRGVPQAPVTKGDAYLLEGEIPAARVHELEQQLPTLTSGEGVLECAFARYRPVVGEIPSRPRTDHDPLNRKEYLLRVVRRVAGA
ncbi:TetM/TetW/TetO/TetS family tetracycline resistance ribosomal protection protein [Streptomyces bathyalis]|uniref:TetM/TetW/TetO/TetS family tetracycline resistance ribosomal protection protein n=1 Tax=Streptomyces bathyalis TaxID=2710756 RepID=A0A7T1T5T8_9ACTN|nr:TetM/TetW/TetO/TetS family tetracycline resistance ribosomal protection protein [Streptomyces bathyalis]QPP06888.1 TetM/TetW/TetO/TetS family tetracycline resistance ribosomal protection protein [Streptomyces bathyalis]